MTIAATYDEWASSYDEDRNKTRDLDGLAMKELLSSSQLGHTLELGCGTGKNTLLLASLSERVTALDFSAAMIEKARKKVTSDNVSFFEADITRSWPLDSGQFDFVVTNLVLEHISDLAPIFAEAHRVLVPGGNFLISELHPFRQYLGSQANFKRSTPDSEEGAVKVDAFTHNVSEFLDRARDAGFSLLSLREWWHEEDAGRPPRLLTLRLSKI
ncbi:MAG: class I SAM-dependent methyltransferase [Cyanobacteria bacterium HKST-UBA02]|nr:class I SAM-dependent methyltransferase [Cyanobacteria bacterium HKST-UBA02]